MTSTTFSIESIAIGLGTSDLKQSTLNAIQWFLGFLFLAALVYFIAGAANWMISGDSDVVKTRARRMMIYSLMSMIIVLLAYGIVVFVARTTANVTN